MFDRVCALQPAVIFGDIADQIPLGQADRGVGFNAAFDVFSSAFSSQERDGGSWM
jgi:hypothetical protein